MFHFFKSEIRWWLEQEAAGEVEVWFSDESGFHLNPNSMYGWQEKGKNASKKVLLPAQRAKAINILGFIRTTNEGEFYEFSHAMDTSVFIHCVNSFIEKRATGKKILLILDRATPHKNARVEKEIKKWKQRNVYVQFLPAYCSELNYIEILWKHIKHHWLDINAWQDVKLLKEKVLDILAQFGREYTIKFTNNP